MSFPGFPMFEPSCLVVGLFAVGWLFWAWALVHCFGNREDPDRLAWLIVLCGAAPFAVPLYWWHKMR
jgi:hypothetical protein